MTGYFRAASFTAGWMQTAVVEGSKTAVCIQTEIGGDPI